MTNNANRLVPFRFLRAQSVTINLALDISDNLLDLATIMDWVFPVAETVLVLGVVQLPFDAPDLLCRLQVAGLLLLG